MTTQHTPGPWMVSTANYKDSAPELLEALIEILPHAEVIINDNHQSLKKAKVAIAKATNQTADAEI